MTASITTLEQLLERYGDTLYRIAILFAASPAQAHDLLLRFARSHTTSVIPSDDQQLLLALLPFMAEIPERRQTNTQHALRPMVDSLPGGDAQLLTAILKLPRAQRAALAFLALQLPVEEGMQLEQQPLAELRRDALLALAAVMNRPNLATALTDPEADELCRTTRASLMLEELGQHHTAAVRGHLALCTDCRTLSQSWQGLVGQVSDGLRSMLRTVHMPEEFGERMLAAAEPVSSQGLHSFLRSPWLLRMVLPVLVLSLIAILVFWRAPEAPNTPTATGSAPVDLKTLITRAQNTLYTSQSEGVQLQYYQMRWPFGDGSYAPLVGQIWRDPASNQLRAQLTHESGGAPYEFLMTGRDTAWYAVTSLYGDSIYPLLMDTVPMRVQFQLGEQQLRELSQATLAKGAWGLPNLYLEQAQAATLQSWGRQRAEDATLVEVIGYRSKTAFSMPAAQKIDDLQVTVLLMIDPAKGQLREVREVFGPPGGDQISRTLWRFIGSETLTDEQEIGRTFNIAFAWNGTGSFEQQNGFVHAALPLISRERLLALSFEANSLLLDPSATSMDYFNVRMPANAPEKARAAFLIRHTQQGVEGASVVYLGPERLFVFRNMPDTTSNQALFPTDQSVEPLTVGQYQILLRPVPGGYAALLRFMPDGNSPAMLMLTHAYGYSREQVLATVATVVPLNSASLKQQIDLFSSSTTPSNVRELLLAALRQAQPQPADQVRQLQARLYARQNAVDTLSDPYHRRPYDGLPAEEVLTNWYYPNPTGQLTAFYQERRGADDILNAATLSDGQKTLVYDRFTGVSTLDGQGFYASHTNMQENILLTTLICGGGQVLEQSDTTTVLMFTERKLSNSSCLWSMYPMIMSWQLSLTGPERFTKGVPYLADLGTSDITLYLTLDQQHGLRKAETSAMLGAPVVLERWELLEDRLIPLAEAPSVAEREKLIEAAGTVVHEVPATFLLQQVTMTDTLKLAGGRMFVPAKPEQASYYVAVSQPLVGSNFQAASNSVFELALWQGVATQMLLPVQQSDGQEQDYIIYQGPARPFREFLQQHASWQNSAPMQQVSIAGQTLDGWIVFIDRANDFSTGNVFVIIENDGILMVFTAPMTAEQQQALDGLRLLKQ